METIGTSMERYCREGDVIKRCIAGEVLLVPVRRRLADLDCVYVLQGTGEFLWEQLDAPRTAAELAEQVEAGFAVDRAEAAKDVDEFLGELVKVGLVKKGVAA